jgi:hypothetical protein
MICTLMFPAFHCFADLRSCKISTAFSVGLAVFNRALFFSKTYTKVVTYNSYFSGRLPFYIEIIILYVALFELT